MNTDHEQRPAADAIAPYVLLHQAKRTIARGNRAAGGLAPVAQEQAHVRAINDLIEVDVGGSVQAFGWGGDDFPIAYASWVSIETSSIALFADVSTLQRSI